MVFTRAAQIATHEASIQCTYEFDNYVFPRQEQRITPTHLHEPCLCATPRTHPRRSRPRVLMQQARRLDTQVTTRSDPAKFVDLHHPEQTRFYIAADLTTPHRCNTIRRPSTKLSRTCALSVRSLRRSGNCWRASGDAACVHRAPALVRPFAKRTRRVDLAPGEPAQHELVRQVVLLLCPLRKPCLSEPFLLGQSHFRCLCRRERQIHCLRSVQQVLIRVFC